MRKNHLYTYPGKRALDVITASALLAVGAPILLALALAIRWESPGPGLFRQMRVGRHGKNFVCFKLRTMSENTRSAPSHEISASHVTRLGHFLRRTKLDELPQLWNIVRGEMSLVGPRPCLPIQTELIDERKARHVDRLRPGITGVSQVADVDMSIPERLANLDQTYISQMSLLTDLRLLLQTVQGSGRGDKVRPLAAQRNPDGRTE
jgi:O-antigen biosynthesis protein WbqP